MRRDFAERVQRGFRLLERLRGAHECLRLKRHAVNVIPKDTGWHALDFRAAYQKSFYGSCERCGVMLSITTTVEEEAFDLHELRMAFETKAIAEFRRYVESELPQDELERLRGVAAQFKIPATSRIGLDSAEPPAAECAALGEGRGAEGLLGGAAGSHEGSRERGSA